MGTARVVHLTPTTTARLSDGRVKGDHGNRASGPMRASVVQALQERANRTRAVPRDLMQAEATRAGVSLRTVERWWNNHVAGLRREAQDEPERLPPWLRRYEAGGRALELTRDEIKEIAEYSTVQSFIDDIKSDGTHRLSAWSRASLYEAWNRVPYSVRSGIRKGFQAQARQEMTLPLSLQPRINEMWTIDEYDLKLTAVTVTGHLVEPKLLVVRDQASGVPLAVSVLEQAANQDDACRILGAAVLGFERDGVQVVGAARLLRTDQGSPFMGETTTRALAGLGIGIDPIPSYTPRANGSHEVMHQTIARFLEGGPGSRRGYLTRSGVPLDHGQVPMAEVARAVARWRAWFLDHEVTSGRGAGQTPWGTYVEMLAAGDKYMGPDVTDRDLAGVAPLWCERTVDATRGVHVGNRYMVSVELARAARPRMRVRLHRLLDPDVVYAFDARTGAFIGALTPRHEQPAETHVQLHDERARRERFVSTEIAGGRAHRARQNAELLSAEERAAAEEPPAAFGPAPEAPPEAQAPLPHEHQQEPVPTATTARTTAPRKRRRKEPASPGKASAPAGRSNADDLAALFKAANIRPLTSEEDAH